MKKQTLALLIIALFSSSVFARGGRSTAPLRVDKEDSRFSSQGFRIAFVKPFIEAEVKASVSGTSFSAKSNIKDTNGVSVGYAYLPIQAFGFTTNLTYLSMTEESTASLLRLDGNAAFAINRYLNIKGGANISKFVGGDGMDKYDAGIGVQGSLGVQITKNFGLDVGYAYMKQNANSNGVTVELRESGLELALSGTF